MREPLWEHQRDPEQDPLHLEAELDEADRAALDWPEPPAYRPVQVCACGRPGFECVDGVDRCLDCTEPGWRGEAA